ncbi:MAG: hypothetical protein AAB535_01640 [Patescibacteria group bacterium]
MKKKVSKLNLGLPELLRGKSRFSGGASFQKIGGAATKFTPPAIRITQHKGGGGK